MKLFFCGDIMPGGVLPYQDSYITPELKEYMASFDFRIGTLEAAIGTGLPYDPVKMNGRANIVYARNEDFFRVKEMGFDVVSLANNHIWDLGVEGLKNTIQILKENNIKYCGAGLNDEEASCPAVIEKEGIKVAILACCMYGKGHWISVPIAKENEAGINPLDITKVLGDIKSAKSKYDYVIILPHWGNEYTSVPNQDCVSMAKQMIAAGADAVLGSHTHQIQPLVFFNGKPVCFSMGNFLFPDFYMYPPRPIWYPKTIEETIEIKDVMDYPYPINEPIRRVWSPISRYGNTISLEINQNVMRSTFRYVHTTIENVATFGDPDFDFKKLLSKESKMITNSSYRFAILLKKKVRKVLGSVYHKILGMREK